MRFGAKLHLTEDQLAKTKSLESTAFRHVSVINDIYSWEREWKVSQASPSDGAQPFSAVSILAKETGLPFPACKRLLYSYCRELEIVFKETGHKIRNDSSTNLTPELEKYLHGLELFMSGIETWSRWTPRYRQ
jgi:aristolochene synthase